MPSQNEYPEFLRAYREGLIRQEVRERDEEIYRKHLAETMNGGYSEGVNSSFNLAQEVRYVRTVATGTGGETRHE